MKGRMASAIAFTAALAVVFTTALGARQTGAGEGARRNYSPPRTADGQPDMQGVWGAVPNGSYSIQDLEAQTLYQAQSRPDPALHGKSRIVDPPDGKIPYQPWALEYAKQRFEGHFNPTPETLDPSARCFLHGVPRSMINREFEIFQPAGHVVFLNMAHHTYRDVPLDGHSHIPPSMKLWMGDSRGRWEGNTLVVDVTNQNDQTWLDIVGDYHSDAIHVVERHTIVDADTINYETTIEDPKVYTRPWKMAVRMERMKDYGELWEEACFEGNAKTLEGLLKRPGK